MSWQDVQLLRQKDRLDEAREKARELLAANPDDFKVRSQYEWVIFGFIKRNVTKIVETLKKGQPVARQDIDEVMAQMREYHPLRPHTPDMACSTILGQIIKVGPHLPKFPEIIRWIGLNGLRQQDWEPNEYQGKTYPSLALNIARALSKWVKAHPDASVAQINLSLEWAERVKSITKGDDALWLNWDIAILLRKTGDFHRAAELLAGVIKAKRNEFWVWAEAGRLYESEQPELALACFCRALECPTEPKFLVRAHRELAKLLSEQGDFAQASREVANVIEIRQAEGWPMGDELETLIASHWYDPIAEGAENDNDFYARHSTSALTLCFDVVETKMATYLGLLIPHRPTDASPDWQPKPVNQHAKVSSCQRPKVSS